MIHDDPFFICRGLKSYQGLVSHQGIPDACHCLPNAQVGVKLVTVEAGHELGQEWSQLLSSLGCNHVETKSCSLKAGGGHMYKMILDEAVGHQCYETFTTPCGSSTWRDDWPSS